MYEVLNKPEEAQKWRAKVRQTEAMEERDVTTCMAATTCLTRVLTSLTARVTILTPQTLTLLTFSRNPHLFFVEQQAFYGNFRFAEFSTDRAKKGT
jgi:hypothetical protein